VQTACNFLLRGPSYCRFCPKFRCHANGGESGVNINDAVKLADPENHTLEPKITIYLIHSGVMAACRGFFRDGPSNAANFIFP